MKIGEALKDVKRLYVETAPLIYYVEANPTYLAKMDAIIELIEQKPIAAISSVITLTEVLTLPLKQADKQLEQEYRDILENNVEFSLLPVTEQIANAAAVLRAGYGLRTPDALHLATAIDAQCDAFLTNDIGLKRVKEISLLVLDELVP